MARNRAPYLNGFSSSQATLPKYQQVDPFEEALQKHANQLRDIVKQDTKQSFFYQREEASLEKYQDSYIAPRNHKHMNSQISTLQASSISVKRPKEIIALPKNDSKSEEEKEMQYLKSSQYRKYLERIVQGVKNQQDLVKQMKEARNHNVYLDKSKQKPIATARNQQNKRKVPEIPKPNNQRIKIEEQFQSITNLSMITAKEEILIIEPKEYIKKSNLTCNAYLEDISNDLDDYEELEQSKDQMSIFNKISAIPHPIIKQNKALQTYSPCESSELSFKPKTNKISDVPCQQKSPLKSISPNLLSTHDNVLLKNKEIESYKQKKPLIYQDEIRYAHKQQYKKPERQLLQKEKSRSKNPREGLNEQKRYYQPKNNLISFNKQENYCQKSIQKSKKPDKASIYAVDFKLSRPNLAQSNTSIPSSRPTTRMYEPLSTTKSSQLTQVPASHSRSRSKSNNRKMSIVTVSSKAIK